MQHFCLCVSWSGLSDCKAQDLPDVVRLCVFLVFSRSSWPLGPLAQWLAARRPLSKTEKTTAVTRSILWPAGRWNARGWATLVHVPRPQGRCCDSRDAGGVQLRLKAKHRTPARFACRQLSCSWATFAWLWAAKKRCHSKTPYSKGYNSDSTEAKGALLQTV